MRAIFLDKDGNLIENIPYNETRGYVQRILWDSLMFTWLRTKGHAQKTESWLTSIHSQQAARLSNKAERP